MAQFFEKLEAETKGKNLSREFFLSDHPNPEHRVGGASMKKSRSSGVVPPNANRDSAIRRPSSTKSGALPVVRAVPERLGRRLPIAAIPSSPNIQAEFVYAQVSEIEEVSRRQRGGFPLLGKAVVGRRQWP